MSTTYGTQSSITIPSDGDTIDAADVNTPLAALWDQHDFLDTLVALQAILVPTHGLTRFVRGYGHYTFVTSGTYSASTAVSPWILAATDGTAGRWVNQATADARIPLLLQTPAAIRFVSYEPALGPVDFSWMLSRGWCPEHDFDGGGCSGPCAAPASRGSSTTCSRCTAACLRT